MSIKPLANYCRAFWLVAFSALVPANFCATAFAGTDLIVGDIAGDQPTPLEIFNWGKINPSDAITAYSIGTTSCNIGDTGINWRLNGIHPVIGSSAYRLADGRFEQIGVSWVKHGFKALNLDLCDPGGCAEFGNSQEILHPGCSDPYGAQLNGTQSRLGPRSEINASTGGYPFPFTTIFQSGDKYWKRMLITDDDIDPALNPTARYFVESQYITPDDFIHGTQENNVSYREFGVVNGGPQGSFDLNLLGSTVRELPAVYAWQALEPTVEISSVIVPNDGKYFLGCKVTDLGNGEWDYEYFVYNEYSHRSCGAVQIPFGANVQIISTGFHDVHYHGGDGHVFGTDYDGTDWTSTVNANDITFSTTPFATDPNANAIRWGTGYNVRFVANAPPIAGNLTLELFRPGTPTTIDIAALVPDDAPVPSVVLGDMDANGSVEIPDLPLFVDVLLDPGSATPDSAFRADMTEDLLNDGADIALFVAALLAP